MTRPSPRSSLFPYTTLFRSRVAGAVPGPPLESDADAAAAGGGDVQAGEPHPLTPSPLTGRGQGWGSDRKSTRLNSSHLVISYAVFCLKKKSETNHLRDSWIA